MKKPKLPKSDSIRELAEFWATHDLTDFDDELEDVAEPVFVRDTAIRVPLQPRELKAVERLAQTQGVSREELVRAWVRGKIAQRKNGRAAKRRE